MKELIRWIKFNVVGGMGMALQIASLDLLTHWMAGRYLCATAAAIELTLLHNFIWHLQYTWRDRNGSNRWLRPLVRFHLSNGLVSMAGNLILTWLLVHGAHLPLLYSNLAAILCCSIANFRLGTAWVFT